MKMDQRKREGGERWGSGAFRGHKKIEKRVGALQQLFNLVLQKQTILYCENTACNLRPAKSRRVHEFPKSFSHWWGKSLEDSREAKYQGAVLCWMSCFVVGFMYVLFAFSDLSFQQISSKWTIHHYLCWMKGVFSYLKARLGSIFCSVIYVDPQRHLVVWNFHCHFHPFMFPRVCTSWTGTSPSC